MEKNTGENQKKKNFKETPGGFGQAARVTSYARSSESRKAGPLGVQRTSKSQQGLRAARDISPEFSYSNDPDNGTEKVDTSLFHVTELA